MASSKRPCAIRSLPRRDCSASASVCAGTSLAGTKKIKAAHRTSRPRCCDTTMLTACLPLQSQSEADVPLAIGPDNPHEVRCGHALSGRRTRSGARDSRPPEVGGIGQVVELRPELKLHSFLYRKHTRNTEIGVPETRVAHDVASHGPEPYVPVNGGERTRSVVVSSRPHSAQELYSGNLVC